jgi:gamma-glutamylcyclotransferase (GGCT)/AIG2-like uncharacterized protein YtfP
MSHFLFSYGTLQNEAVQLSVFNRKLKGQNDAIKGYRISQVQIRDEEVVAISGLSHHLILIPGESGDLVDGMVFEITDEELLNADDYEAEEYKRVLAPTISGLTVWVYVQAHTG